MLKFFKKKNEIINNGSFYEREKQNFIKELDGLLMDLTIAEHEFCFAVGSKAIEKAMIKREAIKQTILKNVKESF